MRQTHHFLLLPLLVVPTCLAGSMLFNGMHSTFMPVTTSQQCLASFNTALQCDSRVQLLYKQTDWVGWNSSDLAALCTPACNSSLAALVEDVSKACGAFEIPFAGASTNATSLVEGIRYRYNLACLSDGNEFCLRKLYDWDISCMNATWPKFTSKTYYDWSNDPIAGTLPTFPNGTEIQPWQVPAPEVLSNDLPPAALDGEYTGGPRPSPNLGHQGDVLEYDEFPLEIQCSTCFLERFRMGFRQRWGETYDEVTEQIWANIQLNCGFEETLYVYPTLNQSGPPNPSRPPIRWTAQDALSCETKQLIETPPGQITNCSAIGMHYSVSTGTLMAMNPGITCASVQNGTYCLPPSCEVAFNDEWSMSGTMFVQQKKYEDISFPQLSTWNPFTRMSQITYGETLCIGPPGGRYVVPSTTIPARISVYTTTATPIGPTPKTTIKNCGLYHKISKGDACNIIALKYGITFDHMVQLNPSINSLCTNLQVGFNYCVGLVNGTSAPAVTSTRQPSSTSLTGANGVATPQPTESGMIRDCSAFHRVTNNDSCESIAGKEGVKLSDFCSWNTGVGSDCESLWRGFYVCVGILSGRPSTTDVPASTSRPSSKDKSKPSGSSTHSTKATKASTPAVPTPIQAHVAQDCKAFYKAKKGDTCSIIAAAKSISLERFVKLNPDTGKGVKDCTVWLGYYYCVESP